MRRCSLIIVIPAIVWLGSDLRAGDKKDDLDGTWLIKSITQDGKKAPEAILKDLKVVIKKDGYEAFRGDKLLHKGTIKRDDSKTPRTMDVQSTTAEGGKRPLVRAIYKIEGETMTACGAEGGTERPSDFSSAEGSKRELIVYERMK